MVLPRRRFLSLAAAAAVLPALPRLCRADSYPSRPVHLVVGYAAGTSPDIMARLTAQWLSERLGQQFVVDNRPGAAGNIGAEIALKAPPDGYTLLMTISSNAVNASLYTNLNFNFIRDIAPVGSVGATPFVIVVTPSFPVKTVPELIGYAKADPRAVNMASFGIGTTPHVAGVLFMMMTGVEFVHVPYRGNYLPDLLGGQVQMAFSPIAQAIEYMKDGRLRALAVTPAKRSDAAPEVPSVSEFVPGYEASGWYGVCAPRGTPPDIVDKISSALAAAAADPGMRSKLLALGIEPMAMTPATFGKFATDEMEKWAKVIKFADIRAE